MIKLPSILIILLLSILTFTAPTFASHTTTTQPTWTYRMPSRITLPTRYISVMPTKTPTPTPKPTTTPTPKPTTTTPTNVSLTEIQNYILTQINNYRSSKGLSQVQSDKYTCDFGEVRAREISSGFNHDGFTNRINSRTLPYPSYSMITENIAMTSNYRDVVNMWINSPGHAANMQKDTPYVCVGVNGNYYAYEGWKP